MCIIFLAIEQHPKYSLVIAANRDEFYNRPTAQAHFWPDAPGLLAGRDLRSNGTWLGVTRAGRVAMLTNFREPGKEDPSCPSRGELVTGFLLSRQTVEEYLSWLQANGDRYNGFNLIFGTLEKLVYFSNRANYPTFLSPGIYGLSNGLLDDPWPKVIKGKEGLSSALRNGLADDSSALFKILEDQNKPPLHLVPCTGLDPSLEYDLSSIFVQRSGYGTRASTLLLAEDGTRVLFWEKTQPKGEILCFDFFVHPGL